MHNNTSIFVKIFKIKYIHIIIYDYVYVFIEYLWKNTQDTSSSGLEVELMTGGPCDGDSVFSANLFVPFWISTVYIITFLRNKLSNLKRVGRFKRDNV